MILSAYANAVRQLRDRRFRPVIALGTALAIALLFFLYAGVLLVVKLGEDSALSIPLAGEVSGLGTLLSVGSIVFLIGLSIFLMAPVASVFSGLFLNDVADAVEARYYPHTPPPHRMNRWDRLTDTVNYFGMLVPLNFVALMVFALSTGFGIVLFWAVNAFLLAREYFIMTAMRHMPHDQAKALFRQNRMRLWGAGVWLAVPLSIPIVNLLMPVIGAAAFTHLAQQMAAKTPAD